MTSAPLKPGAWPVVPMRWVRWGGWHGVCWALQIALSGHAMAEGLVVKPEVLAPTLLSVPGEALLLDPPGLAGRADPLDEPNPALLEPAEERGLASWYGERFHRRRTASGEPFDMRALTAAHRTLPFGSRVCVRSPVTGRTVVVRINDRGPHAAGRVIDLSRAAAEALGMLGLGLKPVELSALDEGTTDCPDR